MSIFFRGFGRIYRRFLFLRFFRNSRFGEKRIFLVVRNLFGNSEACLVHEFDRRLIHETVHVACVGEANFGFCGMDVDVHEIVRKRQIHHEHRIASGHKLAFVGFFDCSNDGFVFDGPAVYHNDLIASVRPLIGRKRHITGNSEYAGAVSILDSGEIHSNITRIYGIYGL